MRKLLAFAVVLLALRVSLPLLAAPLIAGRLSRSLGARVEIGDIGLNPLDAVVTLRDFAVHAPSHPQPPIAAKEVSVDVQWLPLLHQTLQVRELALQSGHVDLDLLPNGDFGIVGVGRPDPTSELPGGWKFALDRVTLRDARLAVRDADTDADPFLETAISEATFAGGRRRAAVFNKATNMKVDAAIGGGRVRFEGQYDLGEEGLAFDARAVIADVPLAQVLSRVAELGGSDLSGLLSAKLRWQRDRRRLDRISGRVVVRDARADVADLDEPAFSARRGVAEIAAIDLARRKITIQALSLKGATLALRPDLAAPVPLLAAALAPSAGPRTVSGRPWNWTIKRLDARNAKLRIVGAGEPTEVRADAAGENIGTDAYWSPLRVKLEYGDIDAGFDGTLRLAGSPPLEGRLTAGELDLAALARSAELPWAELVHRGGATVDLTVGFDPSEDKDSPFFARGNILLSDVWLAEPEPGGVSFAADQVALTLAGFSIDERRRQGTEQRARRIRFSDAALDAPVLQLMRKRDRALLLPAIEAASAEPAESTEIVFDSLRASAGRLTFIDLVPSPPVAWQVAQLEATARSVVSPSVLYEELAVRGNDRRFGAFELTARNQDGVRLFELDAVDVPLASTDPYLAVAGLPYRFDAGRASISAEGAIRGGDWKADTTLVLQAPVVREADELQRAIGMPIDEAMRRLRDENGDVTLRMALASPRDAGDAHVDMIAAGIRDAIAGVERAAQPKTFSAVSILFPPGRAELTESARGELDSLATLLDTRDDVVVELSPDISRADQRWLAEQALRGMLEKDGGFTGFLRTIGIGRDRERIRKALEARARGEAGALDADDRELLEKLLAEAPPVGEARLAELREARLRETVGYLSTAAGTARDRLIVRGAAPQGGIGLPAVRAQAALSPTAAAAQEPHPRSHPGESRDPAEPPIDE